MNHILKRGLTLGFILLIGLLTITPLPRSAHSQNPAPQRIESDDASVTRAGNWTSQAANQASGGSYLYSSGTADDVLTLEFSGPSIEVIFVAGPSLGTLAINVDDVVLRTVITTADQTAYQQSSRIDYLSDEPHTLKVYAQEGGVVGIDAFVVPTPSPSPPSGEGNADGETRDPFCAPTNQIHRVSLPAPGGQDNGGSNWSKISGNGQVVVFRSWAQLVPADTNGTTDIYVYDRMTCTTELVSVTMTGSAGTGLDPDISGDGRYVVFYSVGDNLVPNDSNGHADIFVRDRQTGTTIRVSAPTDGTEPDGGVGYFPSISSNGRFAVFSSYSNNLVSDDTNFTDDIFVYDLISHTISRVSVATGGIEANSGSYGPNISADGRYVGFESNATNLVAGDTNGQRDVFVHDRQTNTTTLVSVASDGTQGDSSSGGLMDISADGRYVAFESTATNLVSNDTNGQRDVFVRDRQTNTTTRVSVASDGTQGNGLSGSYSISADGRYVGFYSNATNLVPNDTNAAYDGFVHDRMTGITTRISVNSAGQQITGGYGASFSDDGRYATFDSTDSTLVVGDTNGFADAFVAPILPQAPTNLTATTLSQTSIQLNWTDNASDETHFGIERSLNGTSGWSQIGSTVTNVASFTDTVYLTCGTTFYYRVRAYRSGDGVFSGYSNTTNANTAPCRPDALALVNPATRSANLIHTLTNPPAGGDYTQFATGFPYRTGQYVTGDWNGDGLDTLGIFGTGAFYYTNDFGPSANWTGIWFGLRGQPVVGRFDATINHDCLGVTDSGTWTNGDTYFALYFTCNLTSGPTPPLTFQWLSILLPNSQGFTGTFQFVAGDFNGDGVDSVAVRRGAFIAWTNVPPTTLLSEFNLAQYVGAPGTGDEGKVVAGDWDMDNVDSFGLVYQNGTFYRRNDLDWNSGAYTLQAFTPAVGTPFDVASWRPN